MKFLSVSGLSLLIAVAYCQVSIDAALGPQCASPLIRQEWRVLTSAQKQEYIGAVKCLQNTKGRLGKYWTGARSRFDDYVATHINLTEYVHFTGLFQPWHRMLVASYESDLRNMCNYTGAQPYWDWTLDSDSRENWFKSPIFDPVDGFGGNGPFIDSSNIEVPARIPGKTGGGCVMNGPFTFDKYQISLGPGNSTVPNIRCLTRDFCPDWAITKTNKDVIEEPQDAVTFAEFDRRVQGDLTLNGMRYHSGGHFGIGGELGEMGNPFSSPNDPLFYFHHANIDRLWTKWQVGDLEARTQDIAGPTIQFAPPFHFDEGHPGTSPSVHLDYPMPVGELMPGVHLSLNIREVMDTMRGRLCYAYDNLDSYVLRASENPVA